MADSLVCPKEISIKLGSPGLIRNDEWIAHLIFEPENFSPEGGEYALATKISIKRLKREEFSVVRLHHSNINRTKKYVIDPKVEGRKQKFIGAIKVLVEDIRSIVDPGDGVRLVCAFDDPLESFEEHALLGFSSHTQTGSYWIRNVAAATFGDLALKFEQLG